MQKYKALCDLYNKNIHNFLLMRMFMHSNKTELNGKYYQTCFEIVSINILCIINDSYKVASHLNNHFQQCQTIT